MSNFKISKPQIHPDTGKVVRIVTVEEKESGEREQYEALRDPSPEQERSERQSDRIDMFRREV